MCIIVHLHRELGLQAISLVLLPVSVPTGASSMPQYVHSPVGLFPAPLGPSTRLSIVEEVCGKFRFLGKFMAKAIMDSRMVRHGQTDGLIRREEK